MLKTRSDVLEEVHNDLLKALTQIEVDVRLIERSMIIVKDSNTHDKMQAHVAQQRQIVKDQQMALQEIKEMLSKENVEK